MSNSTEYIAKISALAVGGSGVGSVIAGPQGAIGKRAFVKFCLPGEVVRLKNIIDNKKYLEAEIDEIIESSDSRMAPACQHFRVCGGCDLQHMQLAAQRNAKLEIVASTLRHLGKTESVNGIELIGSELPGEQYRSRAIFHVGPNEEIGFFRTKSSEVIDAKVCLLVDPRIDAARQQLRVLLKNNLHLVGSIIIEVRLEKVFALLRPRNPSMQARLTQLIENLSPDESLQIVGAHSNQVDQNLLGRFSQVNSQANNLLVETVAGLISNRNIKNLTELYAGNGNLTHALRNRLSHSTKIDAVELDQELARALAADVSDESNLKVHCSSVEKFIMHQQLGDVLVLDPPRAGAASVFQKIDPQKTKQIIYVSCDVGTLARDIKVATQKGYKLQKTYVLDMFPQTQHIETISLLTSNQL